MVIVAGASVAHFETRKPRMTAIIRADQQHPGFLSVRMNLYAAHADQSLSARFTLPEEISALSSLTVTCGTATVHQAREEHAGGLIFTKDAVAATADNQGHLCLDYRIHVGSRLGGKSVNVQGPAYGFYSGDSAIFRLDDVLPLLPLSKYHVEVHDSEKHSPLMFDGETSRLGSYQSLVYWGAFTDINIHGGDLKLKILAPGAIPDVEKRWLVGLLKDFSPVFKQSELPSLISPGNAGYEQFIPMTGTGVVALDTYPFDQQRAVRTTEALLRAILTSRPESQLFDNRDDSLLLDSIVRYLALAEAWRHGILDKEKTLYDLRRRYEAAPEYRESFRKLPGSYVLTDYDLSTKGVLAVETLSYKLQQKRSSLTELLRLYNDQYPHSLRFGLFRLLGVAETRHFYDLLLDNRDAHIMDARQPLKLSADMATPVTSSKSIPLDLLVTASTRRDLELCGCKLVQAGGAARRKGFISGERRERTIVLDLGEFIDTMDGVLDQNPTAALESQMMVDQMAKIRYDAVVPNPADLTAIALYHTDASQLPLVNLSWAKGIRYVLRPGMRIAVIGWNDQPTWDPYSTTFWPSVPWEIKPTAYERLAQEISVASTTADATIVAGYVHPLTIEKMVSLKNRPTIVLTTASLPVGNKNGYDHGVYIQQFLRTSGSVTEVSGFLATGEFALAHTNTTELVDKSYEDPGVRSALDHFFTSTRYLSAVADSVGEGVTQPASIAGSGQWIGSSACARCHQAQFRQWKATSHSTAFATLRRVHRNHVPACIGCHVVGFGQDGGYSMISPRDQLLDVGCEDCHGGGAEHSANPNAHPMNRAVTPSVCVRCHTADHSDYLQNAELYMSRVRH